MCQKPISKGPVPKAKHPMHTLCTDIVGPKWEETLDGHKYTLMIINSFSCYSWVYLLHSKDPAIVSFCHFFTHLPANLKPTERLITNQGGEFLALNLEVFLLLEELLEEYHPQCHTPQG